MIEQGDMGELPEKLIHPMEVVYISNERLIHTVNDLLNISRIESGKQRYDFKDNDVTALADEVVTKLQIQADVKNLKLIFEKPQKGFPKVVCDSERIHEVMMNFVDNAIKYTKKGSVTVTLRVEPPSSATSFASTFAKASVDKKASEVKQGFGGAGQGMVTFSVKDTGMPHTNFGFTPLLETPCGQVTGFTFLCPVGIFLGNAFGLHISVY